MVTVRTCGGSGPAVVAAPGAAAARPRTGTSSKIHLSVSDDQAGPIRSTLRDGTGIGKSNGPDLDAIR